MNARLSALMCGSIVLSAVHAPCSFAAEANGLGFSAEAMAAANVAEITEQVMQKELELLRLNTGFRQKTLAGSLARSRRLSAAAAAVNGLGEAGVTTVTAVRWHFWRHPEKAPLVSFSAGPLMLVISHSLATAAALASLAGEEIRQVRLHRSADDQQSTDRKVITLKSDIDRLLDARARVLEQCHMSENDEQVVAAESAVLSDLEYKSLNEYVELAAQRASARSGNLVSASIAASSGATGGYLGALTALEAAQKRKPHMASTAGIGFVISGGLIAITPLLRRAVAVQTSRHFKHRQLDLLDGLAASSKASLDRDFERLHRLAEGATSSVLQRHRAIFDSENQLLEQQRQLFSREAAEAKADFIQKVLTGTIMGGCKMAGGSMMVRAGATFHKAGPASPKVPDDIFSSRHYSASQIFNRRIAEANTVFIPGPAVGLGDALFGQMRKEWLEHTACSDGLSVRQVAADRFEELDKLDALLGQNRSVCESGRVH